MKISSWILKNDEREININVKTPETVFEALINHDMIEDPFYGLNEQKVEWVYKSNWIYESIFDVPQDLFSNPKIILRFHGLDTIADIYLNGTLLSSVNNMFRTYEYEVKSHLKKESNILKIQFYSPSQRAQELIDHYGVKLTTGEVGRALPGAPYLRKAQYSFGWDWGPILPDIGIWKPVELIGISDLVINSFYIKQEFEYKTEDIIPTITRTTLTVNVKIDDRFKKLNEHNYELAVQLVDSRGTSVFKEQKLERLNEKMIFEIDNPDLWWTHDLGSPNLYELTIQLIKTDIIDTVKQKIGIRDIKLIKEEDEWGETFYFTLNGLPLFARGANWIPVDSFIPRGKKMGLYRQSLEYAKEANMNMIRVWGGGIYEDDIFYELCDHLGLLVWQDFAFACAIYPHSEQFLENVKNECIDNIKRLRNHPSLALWCGNNEIEYLWNWLKVSTGISEENMENKYKRGYVKLFEQLIPHHLEIMDPQRPYWSSSPSNGFCGMNLGTIHSNSPDSGDSHYWSVWHGGKPFKAYRKFNSRFMSEFGFESFPALKTISSFCPQEQFDINSPIMENHQKNDAGNDLIMRYMKRRYTIPEDFGKQLILSQITQAEAIEYGVKHWRSNRTNFHCMGSLYWQLNDCWPVASWSSIDYFGRWKALHYFAKRFYAPVIAYVNRKKNKIMLGAVNDLQNKKSLIFKWELFNSNGKSLVKGSEKSIVNPFESKIIGIINTSKIIPLDASIENSVLFYFVVEQNTNNLIYRGFKLFTNPNEFNLTDPGFQIKIEFIESDLNASRNLRMHIKSDKISLYTHIISYLVDFVASDNYFSLKSGEEREILIDIKNVLEEEKKITKKEIINSFEVNSLFDFIY